MEATPSALHYSLQSLIISSFTFDYSTRHKLALTERKQGPTVMSSWRDPEANGCKGLLGYLKAFQTWPFSVPASPVLCILSSSSDDTQLCLTETPKPAVDSLPRFPPYSP